MFVKLYLNFVYFLMYIQFLEIKGNKEEIWNVTGFRANSFPGM